ncbi:MAG: phenylalanine--tRNA ligase subunit alpha [Campylobacterales bacterium]
MNLEEIIGKCETLDQLEKVRVKLLGRNGEITKKFKELRNYPPEERKEVAKRFNQLKEKAQQLLSTRKRELEEELLERQLRKEALDVTLYSPQKSGALHPVTETIDRIVRFFSRLNFSVELGTLVEDDFHNFEALNLPKYHPARDMQDTFYLKDGYLLRTHTSPIQIHTMLSQEPPIRMISPGAVFRRDYDLTHTPMFHQVEGLVVDRKGKVSFTNLKFILEEFLRYLFGEKIGIRFRPSFFPFTEPSAEVDISCIFCGGEGCRVCKQTGWLEVLGCGMVDQNVFKAVNYEDVSGYAFGMGVERLAMLLYRIDDLRSMYQGDIRLMEQLRW